jgi:hypothetical protein
MSELKKCPWCETEPELIEYKNSRHKRLKYYACPHGCCATPHFEFEEEAREYWNTRPLEDALQAQLDDMKRRLKEAYDEIIKDMKYSKVQFGDNFEEGCAVGYESASYSLSSRFPELKEDK